MEDYENLIYLDHAATCAMRLAALKAMEEALADNWGNASPTYPLAQKAKRALDQARTVLADSIHANWHDLFFTSGGTEADNWALIGAAEVLQEKGRHIVVSSIEHHAILHTCDYLESRGFEITRLPVDRNGQVRPEDLAAVLDEREDTILVSVMTANNEVGTIEPVRTLCRYAHDHGALFHTDAVQAYGKLPLDVTEVPVDLLSVSAHKIGGPKGIGFLYIRHGVQIQSLIHGGAQESGRRAGTENVPAAVGFAAAVQDAMTHRKEEQAAEARLQRYFYGKVQEQIPEALWNGPALQESELVYGGEIPAGNEAVTEQTEGGRRLFNNLSFSFPGLRNDMILMNLDLAGVCASGGSACTTGALDPSHVLMAMHHDVDRAGGTIRFTLGPENTEQEIDRTVSVLAEVVARLRKIHG